MNIPRNLFIVTSVIDCAAPSVFSQDERISQTVKTIQSVRAHDPDAIVILSEGSPFRWATINPSESLFILQLDVTYFNKSKGEAALCLQTLKHPIFNQILEQFSIHRVFKLSGRYELNKNCVLNLINVTNNAHILCKQQPSHLGEGIMVTVTVLYSFTPQHIEYMKHRYQYVVNSPSDQNIEHLIFDDASPFIQPLESALGVQGFIGPTGTFWEI